MIARLLRALRSQPDQAGHDQAGPPTQPARHYTFADGRPDVLWGARRRRDMPPYNPTDTNERKS